MVQVMSRNVVAAITAVIVAVPLGFGLMGAVFCRETLHVSRRVSLAPENATTVSIAAPDRARLSAWWLKAARPNGNCVVVLHGIKDSRASSLRFAPMFLNAGYNVLLPDSRAHGESEGRFVTYGLLEKYDVIAWAAWMKVAGCGKVYGLGESLGAAILIQSAAVRPAFSAIAAEGSYADLREAAEMRVRRMLRVPAMLAKPAARMVVDSGEYYARWVDGLNLEHVSPVRAIASAPTPILLIHGLEDSRTPFSDSEELARANPRNALWLVPNAQHISAAAAAPEEFSRRVLGWFANH
jgi:fermentation-respiration switch protein FrsA (DUF1100 family)